MSDMPDWMYADGVSLADPFDPERIVLAYVRQHRPDAPDVEGLAHDVWIVMRGAETLPLGHPDWWSNTERALAAALDDIERRRQSPPPAAEVGR